MTQTREFEIRPQGFEYYFGNRLFSHNTAYTISAEMILDPKLSPVLAMKSCADNFNLPAMHDIEWHPATVAATFERVHFR
jgi:hypothetical protein